MSQQDPSHLANADHPVDASNDTASESTKPISPGVVGIGMLVLLMLVYAGSQYTEFFGGPQIRWRSSLSGAIAEARETDTRLFVYMHEPGCPHTPRYDRELFQQRSVRDRLSQMVTVRLQVAPYDDARRDYRFQETPTLTLVEPDGKVIATRSGGALDDLAIRTYFHVTEERD